MGCCAGLSPKYIPSDGLAVWFELDKAMETHPTGALCCIETETGGRYVSQARWEPALEAALPLHGISTGALPMLSRIV